MLGRDRRLHFKRVFDQRGDFRILCRDFARVFHILLYFLHYSTIYPIYPVRDRHSRLPVRYENNTLFALLFGEGLQYHSLVYAVDITCRLVQKDKLAAL